MVRLATLCAALVARSAADAVHVAVVYASDPYGQLQQLATAVASGATSAGAEVRLLTADGANYKRDIYEWSDAMILGSAVYNGNPAPSLLTFVNSFDFEDSLLDKVGGAFATGGSAVAGLESVLSDISRSLRTFGVVTAGGSSWKNAHGTGVVTNGTAPIDEACEEMALATDHGSRIAQLAAALKSASPTPSPSPSPSPSQSPSVEEPPAWGETWSGTVSANLTQVGYDAGLVIVNFTSQCSDPKQQKMRTVYGDFDTVLTRCDLGREFIIDPPSRGGGCTARVIGKDVDKRICEACGCPFCVRDTQGSFAHGEQYPSETKWNSKTQEQIFGRDVLVWRGVAVTSSQEATESFALATAIGYDAADGSTPLFVNISHPLWMQTEARIDRFSHAIGEHDFDIPDVCYKAAFPSAISV